IAIAAASVRNLCTFALIAPSLFLLVVPQGRWGGDKRELFPLLPRLPVAVRPTLSKTGARKNVTFYRFAESTLNRVARVKQGGIGVSLWSFACFFCLLCGYYVLRPLRDEMGVQGGVDNLPWLFSATFAATLAVVPVFGFAASRLQRRRLVPLTYLFFI